MTGLTIESLQPPTDDAKPREAGRIKPVRRRSNRLTAALAVLDTFVAREGHAAVPGNHIEGSFALGKWTRNQRQRYRNDRMNPATVDILESRPGWIWVAREQFFQDGLDALDVFVSREGHARVHALKNESGFKLGGWVSKVRRAHHAGKLQPARARALELRPGWAWSGNDGAFQRGLDGIAGFSAREGHARVPTAHIEGEFSLGLWVENTRAAHHRGDLSRERVDALHDQDTWAWSRNEEKFLAGLVALDTFIAREGNAKVKVGHVEGVFPLAQWVGRARTAQRNGRLQLERVIALDRRAGWTWCEPAAVINPRTGMPQTNRGARFDDGLAALDDFLAREGHAHPPTAHVEGSYRLGAWVSNRRTDHRTNVLSLERITALESRAGWVWDAQDNGFQSGLVALDAFVAREGHAQVPIIHVEGVLRLGRWVASVRATRRQGKLRQDRISMLERRSGWSWSQYS
jgi:hypothetical protein